MVKEWTPEGNQGKPKKTIAQLTRQLQEELGEETPESKTLEVEKKKSKKTIAQLARELAEEEGEGMPELKPLEVAVKKNKRTIAELARELAEEEGEGTLKPAESVAQKTPPLIKITPTKEVVSATTTRQRTFAPKVLQPTPEPQIIQRATVSPNYVPQAPKKIGRDPFIPDRTRATERARGMPSYRYSMTELARLRIEALSAQDDIKVQAIDAETDRRKAEQEKRERPEKLRKEALAKDRAEHPLKYLAIDAMSDEAFRCLFLFARGEEYVDDINRICGEDPTKPKFHTPELIPGKRHNTVYFSSNGFTLQQSDKGKFILVPPNSNPSLKRIYSREEGVRKLEESAIAYQKKLVESS